jgi:ABC-type branched-subunit amino acid transport system substrate-binding protein
VTNDTDLFASEAGARSDAAYLTDENASTGELQFGTAKPILVGWLRDLGPDHLRMQSIIDFAVGEFNRAGKLDRAVEILPVETMGAPGGRILDVAAAWQSLKDQGCLGILGPHISDTCIEMRPVVDAGRVPTIATGGTADFAGEYAFGIQWADLPLEGHLIANYCAQQGYRRVAVSYDTACHSAEYLRHLRAGLKRYGIRECAEERISQLTTNQARANAMDAVEAMRYSRPDAIVHLGTGPSGESIARAVRDQGWDIPRIMDDAFFIAALPHVVELFEGWVGTAAYDDDNEYFTTNLARYESWAGEPVTHPEVFACTYTMVTAFLEGLRLAPVVSREGLKRGLESVALFPSAIGGPRTCVGWGPYSRRGVRGADVYVMRRIQDGKSVFEARFDPMLG